MLNSTKHKNYRKFLSLFVFVLFVAPNIKNHSFGAKYMSLSVGEPIVIEAGQTKDVSVIFKNIGKTTWDSTGKNYVSAYAVAPNYRKSVFAGSVWFSKDNPAKIDESVLPGKTGEVKIKLYAPNKTGDYKEEFYLAAENKTWIQGSYFYLKIKVVDTDSTLTTVTTTVEESSSSVQVESRVLINEPKIRVGLYKADAPVKFESEFPYNIFAGQELKGVLYAQEQAIVSYDNGIYNFSSTDLNFNSPDPIRFVPDDVTYFFKLINYNRPVAGRGKNFNAYRGIMEFRYSPKSDMPFVINELPMDEYVAGIAETTNSAAIEYAKALLIAARSYAYQMLGPISNQHLFDVYATTVDQLYLGYYSELAMPRIAQAQVATFGQMVTYNGKPVLTPYFGHSNGRTLSWTEAWGGQNRPWLKSVEAKYDKGLTLWGHGVGMSTRDASQRAVKDGWTYEQILKHYFTGTRIEKIY